MAVKEFWYRQDLDKPVQVRQMSGVFFTEDNEGDLVGVEVSKGGHPYELTGTVIGYIIKEDGVTETVTGTLSSSRAYITLPATALDVPGIIHIAIRVTNGTEKAVVCAVRGLVNRSRSEIVNTSGRTIYGIDDLLAQIATMEQGTAAANAAAESATTAASNATEKAGLANTAANSANTAATKIDSMTVEATGLASGASPTAQVSDVSGHKHIAFGIPKGDTGATPNLSIGTVSTLNPDQSASATISGTAENPVLNLSIPRGQTGTISNAYGSNIPYSESESKSIKQIVEEKTAVMTGATASAAGTAGIVPAPSINDQDMVLLGNGTWGNGIKNLRALNSLSLGQRIGSTGSESVALGNNVTASGSASFAQGQSCKAESFVSHAIGFNTVSKGYYSHAEGSGTTSNWRSQHVFGEYNEADDAYSTPTPSMRGTFVEIVGNGENNNNRSNARTLDWDGNEILAGDLTINNASNPVAVSKMIIIPSIVFAIPGAGASVSYDMDGITAEHRLITWGFSSSPENNPPTDLSWSTANGYFTITNNGTASSETIQPVFALPTAVAISAHVEEGESA